MDGLSPADFSRLQQRTRLVSRRFPEVLLDPNLRMTQIAEQLDEAEAAFALDSDRREETIV